MLVAVPANVRDVCARLVEAGHEAVAVGGAVRDALLGRAPGDWDVATSASPDDVMRAFRHTIPTGVQHGTVTVVTGKGAASHVEVPASGEGAAPQARVPGAEGKGAASHVEVTTFRGEGAYSDARRPDSVTFGVPLVEDLARRDLTVNAIAYDPGKDALVDPFGGRADLEARVLRAVGDPVARFTEDGLRTMRVVRFAAQLEFAVEPATEAAIAPALPSLAKVSRERVAEELRKLLGAREPSRGLTIARRTRIIRTILPDLDAAISDEETWLSRIDRAPKAVRLAALLLPLAAAARVLAACKELKLSRAEAELAVALVGAWATATQTPPRSPLELRRMLVDLRQHRAPFVELWALDAPALADQARAILAAHDPLDTGDLAIRGDDLIRELAMKPGPAIGRILARLLDDVLADPARNQPDYLLRRARELELEIGR